MTETPEEQPKGTPENPLTQKDVLRCIEKNGGTAQGLNLSRRVFEEGIDLSGRDLAGIILNSAKLPGAKFFDFEMDVDHNHRTTVIKDRPVDLSSASLVNSHLENANLTKANLKAARLTLAHLQSATLERADLREAHVEGTDLLLTKLNSAKLGFAYVSGTNFMVAEGIASIDWGKKLIIGEERDKDYRSAIAAYGHLRRCYAWPEIAKEDIAGEFFYREMECRRKALPWWPHPWKKLWLGFLGALCGYGEHWHKVIVSGLTVLLGLTLVYSLFGGLPFWNALYFSAVSFTALGYGFSLREVGIPDWAHGLGAAEALIGVFLTALFLTTFVRKMTR